MEQEKEVRNKKKKKKSRFWHYLYAVVMLLLTIANLALVILLLTYVQQTEVTGTQYSNQREVIEWFQEDPFTKNSLYALWKIKSEKCELPVYLDSVDMGIAVPWNLKLIVSEKEIMAGIYTGTTYVYFDREGLVMTIEQESFEGVPLIENIPVAGLVRTDGGEVYMDGTVEIKQFETLEVEDKKIFGIVEDFIDSLKKQQLSPEKIIWNDGSIDLTFGEIQVQLGKTNFEAKLSQITPILESEELQGKSGVLHLENYSQVGDSITFKPTEAEPEPDTNIEPDSNTEPEP